MKPRSWTIYALLGLVLLAGGWFWHQSDNVALLACTFVAAILGRLLASAGTDLDKGRFLTPRQIYGYICLAAIVPWLAITYFFIDVRQLPGMLVFLGVGLFLLLGGAVLLVEENMKHLRDSWRR